MGHRLHTAPAEEVKLLAAVGDGVAHVFHQAQHGRAKLLEHPHRAGGIIDGHLLRRRDDDRARQRQHLAERQRNVARAGRQVHDQIVQLGPGNVVQQKLLEGALRHRAAPDERLVLLHQAADGHRVNAVHVHRQNAAAFHLRHDALDTQHCRQ